MVKTPKNSSIKQNRSKLTPPKKSDNVLKQSNNNEMYAKVKLKGSW